VKILVIDDDAAVLEVMALMLEAQGHAVTTADGGHQGIDRLAAGGGVDLVLTDLAMPGMSGWEVVRAVRSGWPAVRVGVVTGNPDYLPGQGERVDVLIGKPVTMDTLQQGVQEVEALVARRSPPGA
jgi:CheY-like chemotaxis protein